jgi:hypothetical protein
MCSFCAIEIQRGATNSCWQGLQGLHQEYSGTFLGYLKMRKNCRIASFTAAALFLCVSVHLNQLDLHFR